MIWQDGLTAHDRISEAREIFDFSARLPHRVNRLSLVRQPVFDGDWLFGVSAWPMVSALAHLHADPIVHYFAVDFEQSSHSEGWFGGVSVSALMSSEDFGAPFHSEQDDLWERLFLAPNVLAVWGPSMRWGLWAERNRAGIIASIDRDKLVGWQLDHGPFLTAEAAVDDFAGLNFGGRQSVEVAAFVRNYGEFNEPATEGMN